PFSQVRQVLLGPGLLRGFAALVVVGRPVQADADLGAEALDGTAGGLDAAGLAEVVGEFLVGPVGPVQPLLGGTVDYPCADLVGQCCGNLARFAFGLPGLKPVKPSVAVGVEPTGDRLAVDPQVGGDVLACSAAVGHEDDLEAVAKFAVVGGTEEAVEAFGFGGWQLNADHGAVLSQQGRGSVQLDDGTASMGSCIRSSPAAGPRRWTSTRSSTSGSRGRAVHDPPQGPDGGLTPMRRQFQLPEADEAHLVGLGRSWETVIEG